MMLTVAFTACSSDDDPMPETVQDKVLKVEADTIKMEVNATTSLNITDGGGEYKVFSENPDIVEASVNNNVVTVTSLKKGKTGLVISDAQGNYKRVLVKSMYMSMTLDKSELNVGIKLGHKDGIDTVKVTAGNGGYTATVANTAIAKAVVKEGNIIVTALTGGTTTVTVTDIMGLTQTFTVTVNVTTVAFTDKEKQQIVSNLSRNYVAWDDTFADSNSEWSGDYTLVKSDGDNVVSWDYYNYYYINFHLGADLSVGVKQNCKVTAKPSWSSPATTYDNATAEILKNDGQRVWGIVYVVKDNYLHLGYFCMEL